MATFRVGQRVRILSSVNWPELAGKTGTVVGGGGLRTFSTGDVDFSYEVAPDVWGDTWAPCDGLLGAKRFTPKPHQLAPATDCYDKAEWASLDAQMPDLRHIREAVYEAERMVVQTRAFVREAAADIRRYSR